MLDLKEKTFLLEEFIRNELLESVQGNATGFCIFCMCHLDERTHPVTLEEDILKTEIVIFH